MSRAQGVSETPLKNLQRYVDMRRAKPLGNVDDERIHGIHVGTEWEAELLMSDIRSALTEINQLQQDRSRLMEALTNVLPHIRPGDSGEVQHRIKEPIRALLASLSQRSK